MVMWEEVREEKDILLWDDILLTAKDYSIFQSIAWGELKKNAHWLPVRYWIRNKNGNVLAMAQLLVKRLPMGISMLWSAGGPVFLFPISNEKKITEYLEGLVNTIKKRYTKYIVRFNSYVPNAANLSYNINKICLRPLFKLGSGYTISMELDMTPEELRSQMTSKHRYYAKQASGSPFTWSIGNTDQHLQELSTVYREMIFEKKLSRMVASYDDFYQLRNALKENVLVLTGYLNNIPVTSCLVLIFGQKSYYLYAATCKEGRDVSASYAMFEKLVQELRTRKATDFDFGCIDPENPAAEGVDHFKKGFGGEIQEYLGEWESASSSLLRLGVNTVMKLRAGRA
jgi:lipid II:glycine glycyltransferase (peptidoglycan interpeptide bridge formation enzyme)